MDPYQLENYLRRARELFIEKQQDPETATHEIFRLLEEHQTAAKGNPSDEAFFDGEYHFSQGEHELALKCYLEAKEIPNFQFFCYRSSALISKERGQLEQALNYAQKAFELDALDPTIQELIQGLQCHATSLNQESAIENQESDSIREDSFVHSRVIELDLLEKRIQEFQVRQAERLQEYLKESQNRLLHLDNSLHILNGWSFPSSHVPVLLTEESRQSHGGHYLRWNGKGIALNPGPEFLNHFHAQGLCIRDIDYVIVTRPSHEAHADVRAISELNLQLNKIASDRHIIQYYLHQKAYQELSNYLKPSFKQARNTIHKLEMFLDSPDVEKIELEEGITLHYFLTTMQESLHTPSLQFQELQTQHSNLGIRLELANDHKKLTLGYLAGICWSPLIAHHLGHCDLLLAGFGNTHVNDFSMLGYNEDSLGYCGTATLLQQLAPKLLLLTEFGGRNGDIRIELTKKMRLDHSNHQPMPLLLPADIGLTIKLESLQVKCSLSEAYVPVQNIHVVSNSESFGRLSYLSNHFCA